jgi:hypothetical protein
MRYPIPHSLRGSRPDLPPVDRAALTVALSKWLMTHPHCRLISDQGLMFVDIANAVDELSFKAINPQQMMRAD